MTFNYSENTAEIDPRFYQVLEMLRTGQFGTFDELPTIINSLVDGRDHYLVSVDFGSCTTVILQFDIPIIKKFFLKK